MFKRLFSIFDTIGNEASKERKGRDIQVFRKQIWAVLVSSAVILFALHYLKYSRSFIETIKLTESLFGIQHHM